MRHISLTAVLAASVLAWVSVQAGTQVPGDDAEIRQLEQQLAAAWVKGDRAFIAHLLATDWTVIDQAGRVLTKQQVLDEAFSSAERRVEELTIDDVKVRLLGGGAAVATGRTRATGSYRGDRASVTLRFTDVFHFRDGRWQIVASQGTTVAQERP